MGGFHNPGTLNSLKYIVLTQPTAHAWYDFQDLGNNSASPQTSSPHWLGNYYFDISYHFYVFGIKCDKANRPVFKLGMCASGRSSLITPLCGSRELLCCISAKHLNLMNTQHNIVLTSRVSPDSNRACKLLFG